MNVSQSHATTEGCVAIWMATTPASVLRRTLGNSVSCVSSASFQFAVMLLCYYLLLKQYLVLLSAYS